MEGAKQADVLEESSGGLCPAQKTPVLPTGAINPQGTWKIHIGEGKDIQIELPKMCIRDRIREELKGTFLENAPLVRVSALTGEGIPRLKEEIERMVREQQGIQKKDALTRLPVDRVFSLTGFGTIVTGTVLGGKIAREDILDVYPLQKKCRVRNIQVHGEDVLFCMAGQRAALNLAGCAREELGRGCAVSYTHLEKGRRAYRHHEEFHRQMTNAVIDRLGEEEIPILIKTLENLAEFFLGYSGKV